MLCIVFALYAHEEPRESKPCPLQSCDRTNRTTRRKSEKEQENKNGDGRERDKIVAGLCPTASFRHHFIHREPAIEANNFELSPTLLTFVERDKFDGHPLDNPNVHLNKFLSKCNTIKFNRVSTDGILRWLFHFSLKDRASD